MGEHVEKMWKEFWESTGQNPDPLGAIDLPMVSCRQYFSMTERVIDLLSLNSEDQILNIGCGVGLFEEIVSQSVNKCVGLDFAWSMVKKARIRNAKTKNTFFLQASGTSLPFVEGYFNKILCHGVVLYLSNEEVQQLLKEIKRVARPSSLILICEFVDQEGVTDSQKNGITERVLNVWQSAGWKGLLGKVILRVAHFVNWAAERLRVKWSEYSGKYVQTVSPTRISNFTRSTVLGIAESQGLNGTIIEQGTERFRPGRFNLLIKT